jgi:uncharacterized protein
MHAETTPPSAPDDTATAVPPVRHLFARPLEALGSLVGRFPAAVVASIVAITVALMLVPGADDQAGQDQSAGLDIAEVVAAETIGERFGDDSVETITVVVRSDTADLRGAEGHAAAAGVENALREAPAGRRIVDSDDRPGVLSWLFPAELAWSGAEPATPGDTEVEAAYAAGLAELPEEHATAAQALLPTSAAGGVVDIALVQVVLDASGPEDRLTHDEQTLETHTDLAAAVAAADLPAGITAEAFSTVLLEDDGGAFDTEIGRLFAIAFLIIVIILAFVYWVRPQSGMSRTRSGRRSAADMLLSMAAIVVAILWMLGASVLLGPGYLDVIGSDNSFTAVIPILLIGLGVDYAIHLTSRYREEVGTGLPVTAAVRGAVRNVGGALVLATVTTALGFLTNLLNPLGDIRDFGVLAALGIVAAFVLMLTFVPATRLLLDRRAERAGRLPAAALGRSSDRLLPSLMSRTAVLAERAPVPTLVVTLLLAGLGAFGLSQLETRFDTRDFIAEDAPELATLDELTERFDGAVGDTTDVLITGTAATSAVHNALVDVHDALPAVDDVVRRGEDAAARSVVSVIAQLIAPGPDGGPASSELVEAATAAGMREDLRVPAGADVAALYDVVLETAPEAAESLLATGADGTVDAVRVTMETSTDNDRVAELVADLDGVFAPVVATGAEVVATSDPIMNEAVIGAIEDSQLSSLATTLLVAMALLVAVFAYERRRPLLGVITILPVVLVVLWTFGMMAATGIPFGPITATIAAIAIGIGLPYAIHVTHRFTEDRRRFDDVGEAIRSTVRHTGGAMAGSAFTTMAGFGILTTSSLVPFRQLGAVTVYAVGFSLLAATLVLPSLLVLWDRWHTHRADPSDDVDGAAPLLPAPVSTPSTTAVPAATH